MLSAAHRSVSHQPPLSRMLARPPGQSPFSSALSPLDSHSLIQKRQGACVVSSRLRNSHRNTYIHCPPALRRSEPQTHSLLYRPPALSLRTITQPKTRTPTPLSAATSPLPTSTIALPAPSRSAHTRSFQPQDSEPFKDVLLQLSHQHLHLSARIRPLPRASHPHPRVWQLR